MLDESHLKDIQSRLTGSNENDRLKACDLISKLSTPQDLEVARQCIPTLREIFLQDKNAAVKFLAKKALQKLGEDLEKIRTEAQKSVGPPAPDENGAFLRDHPAMWRCAQEVMRPCLALLPNLMPSADERTIRQVSSALEKCGTEVAAVPLLLVFQGERANPRWQEREAQDVDIYADVQELIQLMRYQASGINPVLAAQMGNLRRPEVLAAFIDMLRSESLLLREGAVRVLADLADARTVDPLLRLLGVISQDFDSQVIRTLSKIARSDGKIQIEVLKRILSHFRPGESDAKLAAIVDAVGRIAHERTLDFVKGCLRHPVARVRANAIEALSPFNIPPEERVKLVFPLFKDENNRVLANAVVSLWGTSAQSYALARAQRMAADQDKWIRASIAYALGHINAPELADEFIRLLIDPDADVRRNAVRSLRMVSNPSVVDAFSRYLTHADPTVRVYVVECIGRQRMTSYEATLVALTEDPQCDLRVLSATVLALGRLRNHANLEILTRYLRHNDERVRANAVEGVEALDDPKTVALLQASMVDAYPRARANAAKALWKYGDLWVADTVKGMLESTLLRFQAAGAYVLGETAAMVRSETRLRQLPYLVNALRRHPKFQEFRSILEIRS